MSFNILLPLYCGHIPALKAENLFAKSFARVTHKAARLGNKKRSEDHDKQRFHTQNSLEYNPYNFSRFMKEPELLENKDYNDYAKFIDSSIKVLPNNKLNHSVQYNEELRVMNKSSRLPFGSKVMGKCKAMSEKNSEILKKRACHNNSVQYSSSGLATGYGSLGNANENSPLRPKLIESKVIDNKKFMSLSKGFQRLFAKDQKDSEIKIPIAGYGGHRVGYKSNNIYGKPFRKCSIESKRIQRIFNFKPNFK